MKFSIATAIIVLTSASAAPNPGHVPGGRFGPSHSPHNITHPGPSTSMNSTSALEIYDNTPGLAYMARVKKDINARVLAYSDPSGWGTIFHLNANWLDPAKGPYNFHIHDKPVNGSGDCMSTGGHLDPYGRGTKPTCDSSRPETCEVGDMSGKYGALTLPNNAKNFVDVYTSTVPNHPAYFGNRSFVIHDKDNNRIACANFFRVPMPSFGDDNRMCDD